MDKRVAKDLLHLREWLSRAARIVEAGRDAYADDVFLQEAGDSLMMKIGETANRLSRAGVTGPDGVDWASAVDNRNWLIHQYDQIDRDVTWSTLVQDLPTWQSALIPWFAKAETALGGGE